METYTSILRIIACAILFSTAIPCQGADEIRSSAVALTPAPSKKSEAEIMRGMFDKCVTPRAAFGDLVDIGLPNWSVGVNTSTPVVKYTFGTKQASSAVGAGVGLAIRYYGRTRLGNEDAAKDLGFSKKDLEAIKKLDRGKYFDQAGTESDPINDTYFMPLYKISTECRATTSDIGKDRKEKLAGSIVSITPTVYYSKQANEGDLSLQPALLLGFFDDIVNIGPGFNLTGPEKGKVFLVFSLGYGFKF